jgi:hypothetical protein
VRPEQQQRERGQHREGSEQRQPLAATGSETGRETGTHGDEHEEGDEEHRRGQVRRHRLPAVAEADRLPSEPRLKPDEPHRADRRP